MLPTLTRREVQILKLIVHGLTNKEISFNLSISESTVENHVHHIYGKLGISNRAQAVTRAFLMGIVRMKETWKIEGILHDDRPDVQ